MNEEEKVIRIGILDDTNSKIDNLVSVIELTDFRERDEKSKILLDESLISCYEEYTLKTITLALNETTTVEDINQEISDESIDFLLIDYKLNGQKLISIDNGTDVASEILQRYEDFPLYIMTSYEADLYKKEDFSPYQVINYGAFAEDKNYRNFILGKMIQQVLTYRRSEETIKSKILSLLRDKGDAKTDALILSLDNKLERRINGKSAIDSETKKTLGEKNIIEILHHVDLAKERLKQ